ncbi:hypothetical protein M8818_003292 [Zalaria obscura]|uniref:Uncharacterized protein n=1 Tax=Zalaria obscura TaxID=2024903 RepID=A0ACC3SGM4_9PEZI
MQVGGITLTDSCSMEASIATEAGILHGLYKNDGRRWLVVAQREQALGQPSGPMRGAVEARTPSDAANHTGRPYFRRFAVRTHDSQCPGVLSRWSDYHYGTGKLI